MVNVIDMILKISLIPDVMFYVTSLPQISFSPEVSWTPLLQG